jgi:predicted HTH domain antitoxin
MCGGLSQGWSVEGVKMAERMKLAVELPKIFVPLVGVSEEELPAEIEKLLALELVRQGALTYTKAAELVGTSQAEFISYLGAHRVSIFRFAPDELHDEVGS